MKKVRPKKNLGQHFLTDLGIARRIADTVDAYPDIPVLEIGPGMGVMTQFLITKPRPFKAVEIDEESVEYLNGNFNGNANCHADENNNKENVPVPVNVPVNSHWLIQGDFLKMDLNEVFEGRQFVLTGNYPYDISSQIFFKMLDNKELIPCCTGMIQREVAQRIAAKPGNKTYGILSVLIQAWYDTEYLFTVDETVFNPPPKVKSAVIRMTRNSRKDIGCDWALFKRVVKATFNQRRKMLRGSLKQLIADPLALPLPAEFLTKRPEQLTHEEFVKLTNAVAGATANGNGNVNVNHHTDDN